MILNQTKNKGWVYSHCVFLYTALSRWCSATAISRWRSATAISRRVFKYTFSESLYWLSINKNTIKLCKNKAYLTSLRFFLSFSLLAWQMFHFRAIFYVIVNTLIWATAHIRLLHPSWHLLLIFRDETFMNNYSLWLFSLLCCVKAWTGITIEIMSP